MRPQTEDDVRDAVRDAHDRRDPVRIVGRGTWPLGGYPVEAARALDLSALTGIVEYVPGDLTLTARAGTTLGELAEATREHGQWLALDPFGAPDGTLGATLATASAGPLAGSVGLPRDVTVGIAFVAGDGRLVQGGGRVVKNVAGFDLVRMTIGAWGTLGVITAATVRLRARPEADETVALPVPDGDGLDAFLTAFRDAPVDPLAAELLSPTLATRLSLGDDAALLVRLAGNAVAVRHQREVLARLAPAREVPDDAWGRLRDSDPADACIVRVSRRPTELARLWRLAVRIPGAEAHAAVRRGIVRLRWAEPPDPELLAGLDPADVRLLEQRPGVAAGPVVVPAAPDELSRRLRLAFDPERILNPGVLGEPRA